MENYSPYIEVIDDSPGAPKLIPEPWYRSRRFIIFATSFLVTFCLGQIINYSRPEIFKSSATLLTSAKTAIDLASSPADIQHVVIQQQILLGQELLLETLKRLDDTHPGHQLTVPDIRQMLQVNTIEETNMVTMSAEGVDPDLLSALINTWIDVYLEARSRYIAESKGETTTLLQEELQELEAKIEAKRQALNEFRQENDIASTGREENIALARLNGLTTSLNNAIEEKVKARARLDAIKQAIADGKPVVPPQEQGALTSLEQRAQELREKLAEFDSRYTREYMALQPSLRFIPREIKKLEKEVELKLFYGKKIVFADAEQNYEAAKHTVEVIKQQLNEQKALTSEFTARFAEHEALKFDLEGLEEIFRETQERLVQIESKNVDKYPQVNVIERAFPSRDPIGPSYTRDALLILLGSLLTGLFSVWVAEFLTRTKQDNAGVTLAGVHMYKDFGLNNLQQKNKPETLERQQQNILASPKIRELSDFELNALLTSANIMGKQAIALLLSGVSLEEITELHPDDFDPDKKVVSLHGKVPRIIPVDPVIEKLFTESGIFPPWHTDNPLSDRDFSAFITLAAVDSGLPYPEEISAEAIRHSYILFLVRQGLRLTLLEQIVGFMDTETLVRYSAFSTPRAGLGVEEIVRTHPVLAKFLETTF